MTNAAPGDPRKFLEAIVEDTYEMVAGLELVTPVLVTSVADLDHLLWPGTDIIPINEDTPLKDIFKVINADQAAIVSGDAPDLPPLLVGKLFRELGRAELTVCPAEQGGAVAIAANLPFPDWAAPDLDAVDPVKELRAQAPGRRMVATTPGWHRLRTRADLDSLDPGLEGWDNTRAVTAR